MASKADQEYLLGQAVTFEQLAKTFQTRAGEAFANNQDEKAKWLRDESKDLERQGKEKRQEYFDAGGTAGKRT